MNNLLNKIHILFILVVIGIMPNVGYADTTELSGANTASILTSTTLVLIITNPDIAFI